MTISVDTQAPFAPIAVEANPDGERLWEEERDAGVRAFRGVLIASAIAVPLWALVIGAVAGLVRLFS